MNDIVEFISITIELVCFIEREEIQVWPAVVRDGVSVFFGSLDG